MPTANAEWFAWAIDTEENCATCKFFRTTEGYGFIEQRNDAVAENCVRSLRIDGECRRFPPVVTAMRDARFSEKFSEETEFDVPEICVIASEFVSEGSRWSEVSDRTGIGRVPWCGEYVHAESRAFFDCDELAAQSAEGPEQ